MKIREKREDMHFMVDKYILGKVASYSEEGKTALEIGPGHGELTRLLKGRVIAVEKDRGMASDLREWFKDNRRIQIIHGNALEELDGLDFDMIISNTPYSILEPLAKKLARIEKPAYLTVPAGFFGSVERLPLIFACKKLFDIPKSAFDPPPKTRSVFCMIEPGNSILRAALKRKGKLKNEVRRALFDSRKMTKKQAGQTIKDLVPKHLQEKRVSDLDLKDLTELQNPKLK